MKPVVFSQLVNKFVILTFVFSYTICFIVFLLFSQSVFSLTGRGNNIFGFLMRKKRGKNFKGKGDEPPLNETMEQR